MKKIYLVVVMIISILSLTSIKVIAQEQAVQQTNEVSILIEALNSTDASQRINAIRRLGELRATEAVQRLSQLIHTDPDPAIRGWCIRSLNIIATPEAIEAIRYAGQNDPDPRVRELALGIVSNLSNQQTVTQSNNQQVQPVNPTPQVVTQTPQPVDNVTVVNTPTTPIVTVTQPTRQRPRGRGLIIGGWSTFGATYGIAIFTGSFALSYWGWKLFIPFLGPILMGATELDLDSDDGPEITAMFWLTIWSLAQVAGISMAIAGHVLMSGDRNVETAGLLYHNEYFGFTVSPYAYQDHMGDNMGIMLSGVIF